MNEMVERVENAIAKALGRDPEAYRGYYREAARAAIEAMREPTRPMLRAAWDNSPIPADDDEFAKAWQAMIDAALATEPVA